MTTDLDEIERLAGEHARLRQSNAEKEDSKAESDLAYRIINSLSVPDFAFPLRDEAIVSEDKTTFVYDGGKTYPQLFVFLSEILHTPLPLVIKRTKIGPSEIIVNIAERVQAESELRSATKELQKLVHGKNARVTQ